MFLELAENFNNFKEAICGRKNIHKNLIYYKTEYLIVKFNDYQILTLKLKYNYTVYCTELFCTENHLSQCMWSISHYQVVQFQKLNFQYIYKYIRVKNYINFKLFKFSKLNFNLKIHAM